MNWQEHKIEWGIFLFGGLVVIAFLKVFSFSGRSGVEPKEISYEMPRPKSEALGDFALDGREVEHRLVDPFKKAETQKPLTPQGKGGQAGQVTQNKTQKKSEKKAEKKAEKAPQVSVNVVENDKKSALGDEGFGAGPHSYTSGDMTGGASPVKKDSTTTENKVSPEQWRALFASEPSAGNMVKLVQAYSKLQVDAGTVYSILTDLVHNPDPAVQKVGVYGLASLPALKSFSILTSIQDKVQPEVAPQVKTAIDSYAQVSRHGILKQALQQSDTSISLAAAHVILNGLQSAQNPSTDQQDPRALRDESLPRSTDKFLTFEPIFQQWMNNGTGEMTDVAQQILAALSSSTAVTTAIF